MSAFATSILIPSFRRPATLEKCLRSLATQTCLPDEVIVVWQGNDTGTRDAATELQSRLPYPLRVLHLPEPGIVPAENTALAAATGDIILLIDDDAIAPPKWLARHLSFYSDRKVGAVGGPAVNYHSDGTPYPRRSIEPVGRLTWYGKAVGNLYNHTQEWISRPPQQADSLVGYNMSLRREAFSQFEDRLKPYWQYFELDACLQVQGNGYQVLVDFANVVDHYPSNPAYAPGRAGDLSLKVYHTAYNHSFVLAKHSRWYLRPWRIMYLLAVGSRASPGLLAFFLAVRRYGHPIREIAILATTWRYTFSGWRTGAKAAEYNVEIP
jgi:glycosyltransferase involved in cell wall biosynthesis